MFKLIQIVVEEVYFYICFLAIENDITEHMIIIFIFVFHQDRRPAFTAGPSYLTSAHGYGHVLSSRYSCVALFVICCCNIV